MELTGFRQAGSVGYGKMTSPVGSASTDTEELKGKKEKRGNLSR